MAYQPISQHPADDSQHINVLATDVPFLLKQLIATPSPSGEENTTAGPIENFIKTRGIENPPTT